MANLRLTPERLRKQRYERLDLTAQLLLGLLAQALTKGPDDVTLAVARQVAVEFGLIEETPCSTL